MENLVNIKEKKEDQFSMIEIFPYLSYKQGLTEEDLQRVFEISLNPDVAHLTIQVRSEEAQKEVVDWLIGYGFDTAEERNSNDIVPGNHSRRYYRDDQSCEYLVTPRSTLLIDVSFEVGRLPEFKRVIKKLIQKKSYRNKWQVGQEFLIK